MAEGVRLDGSYGEGGGQILRTALSLSALLGKPFEVFNIRAGRPRPGLAAQHLTAVQAAAAICGARVEGAALGSQTLRFEPGPVRGGHYLFDVSRVQASAGSVTLVAETIVPALLFADQGSTVVLRGGTHVPWSPPYDYLAEVFLPFIGDMGGVVLSTLRRAGWYPRGGGEIKLEVRPAAGLEPVLLEEVEDEWEWWGLSAVSNLPDHVLRRQAEGAWALLRPQGLEVSFRFDAWPALGPGSICFLHGRKGMARVGFSALGEKGKPAEKVGAEAARALLEHRRRGGVLEPHLADQILLYLALARGRSSFTTSAISQHLLTNAWVIEHFLPVRFVIEGREGGPGRVSVEGVGYRYGARF